MLQGSKIRSTYVAFAQKEKKRLEQEITQTEQEITTREKEVARLKGGYAAAHARTFCLARSHNTRPCGKDRVSLSGSPGGTEEVTYVSSSAENPHRYSRIA